jgi:hypothetical protein
MPDYKAGDTYMVHFMCLSGSNRPHATYRRLTGQLVSCNGLFLKVRKSTVKKLNLNYNFLIIYQSCV